MKSIVQFAVVASLCLAATMHAGAQKIHTIPQGDPLMENAKRKARATLPDFLSLVRAPRSTITDMSVKIGMPYARGVEFFWVSELAVKDGEITGRVNNIPEFVKNVRLGQMLRFTENDIVDWLYLDDGKMKGNYTACVLVKRESKAEQDARKQRFGHECDN